MRARVRCSLFHRRFLTSIASSSRALISHRYIVAPINVDTRYLSTLFLSFVSIAIELQNYNHYAFFDLAYRQPFFSFSLFLSSDIHTDDASEAISVVTFAFWRKRYIAASLEFFSPPFFPVQYIYMWYTKIAEERWHVYTGAKGPMSKKKNAALSR